jgi:CheY-like chemotaxis protein
MKWSDVKKKLMAFLMFKIEYNEESMPISKTREAYFQGAWKEEGTAKWAFFNENVSPDKEDTLEVEELTETELFSYPTKILNIANNKPEDINFEIPEESYTQPEEKIHITELGQSHARYGSTTKTNEEHPPMMEYPTTNLTPDRKINVMIAEDNFIIQKILSSVITKCKDMNLIGIAKNGNEAIKMFKNTNTVPDIILMDICMPEMDGISATREILKLNSGVKIIMLTALSDRETVLTSFEAGAIGFLRKDAGYNFIMDSIRKASMGGAPIQPEVAIHLLNKHF